MSPINAPNCISCGLGGVYHRVTNPKPWRCRTCGSEFSDDDLDKKKEDERRAEVARLAAEARLAEEARMAAKAVLERKRQERERQEEEREQWLLEHGITGSFELPDSDQLTRMGTFEARIGRKFTKKELGAIYQDLARPPHLRTFIGKNTVFKISADAPILQEKPGNSPVRYILAAVVIIAVISYAC